MRWENGLNKPAHCLMPALFAVKPIWKENDCWDLCMCTGNAENDKLGGAGLQGVLLE